MDWLRTSFHGAASKRASCDLSTLSAPDGRKNTNSWARSSKAIRFTDSLVEVAYVCESCGTEIKRTIREN